MIGRVGEQRDRGNRTEEAGRAVEDAPFTGDSVIAYKDHEGREW
jgi:hypothetical protein